MEERKFTPGPWEYRPGVSNTSYYIETVDQSHRNTFIGDIGGGLQDMVEQRANAQLIAAAPELLEALEELLKFCQSHKMDNHYTEQAQSAIQKATSY
jgi:hypothetical protein